MACNWRSKNDVLLKITGRGRVMEVAGHSESFIQKMHLELQMVTVMVMIWEMVTAQDKLYCTATLNTA